MKQGPFDTAAVLARWHARAAEVRSRLAPPGVSTPDQVAGLSGMQVFEAMFNGLLPSVPISETVDMLAVEIEPGRAVF